ncbi:MAG: hypothetical protein GZ087_13385 [Flavobacterium sp.]|nr:hypothetical protein [Flavobacterium sp.]
MKNRKRNRMKGFDYSSDNLYFVTICVQDRICCFGSVISMESLIGTGRDLSVHNSDAINSDAINSDAINSDAMNSGAMNSGGMNSDAMNSDAMNSDEIIKKMELNEFGKIVYDRIIWLEEQYQYVVLHNFVVMPNHVHVIIEIDRLKLKGMEGTACELSVPIKIKSLSSLIGAFKTTSSKLIHESGNVKFAWQRSFHDHIIRNEKSYLNIFNYIDSNPENWQADTFFESY